MDQLPRSLRCMIVDDEPLARELLCGYAARLKSLLIVAQCSNAVEAINMLQQKEIDLVFTDIQMPEILGTEFVKILKPAPGIIFVTAHESYALEGYELDIVDYLLKPVSFERFLRAVNKAFQHSGCSTNSFVVQPSEDSANVQTGTYLYFRTDRKMVKVFLPDVLYIEGMRNYVKIITTNETIITKTSMATVEAMLPAGHFIRAHRSFIVSASKIKSYTSEIIEINDAEIPIGKLFRNEVMKQLSK